MVASDLTDQYAPIPILSLFVSTVRIMRLSPLIVHGFNQIDADIYYQSTGKKNTCKQILVISFSASQARAPDDVIYVVNKTYRNVQLYQLLYIFFCQENIVQSHDTLTCINHVAYLPSARYVSRQESAQVLMYQSCNREFPTALVSLAASLILVIDSISIRFFINTLLPSMC